MCFDGKRDVPTLTFNTSLGYRPHLPVYLSSKKQKNKNSVVLLRSISLVVEIKKKSPSGSERSDSHVVLLKQNFRHDAPIDVTRTHHGKLPFRSAVLPVSRWLPPLHDGKGTRSPALDLLLLFPSSLRLPPFNGTARGR